MNKREGMPYPGMNMFMGNGSPVNLPEDLRKLLEEHSDSQNNCSDCYPTFTESQLNSMKAIEDSIRKCKEQQTNSSVIDFSSYAEMNYPSTEMEVEEYQPEEDPNKKPSKPNYIPKQNQPQGNNGNSNNGFWKFNEDKTLKAAEEYIKSTYHQHYTSEESKVQVLDIIEAIGDGVPFCRDNLIKYSARFGKKNGFSKLDAMKIIHYGILLYNFAGFHKNTTDRYETF